MCDTLFAPKSKTAYAKSILGKNSDRDANEPQYLTYLPAADHPEGERVHCTYIDVEQVSHTYGVILSKPSWIWGGEIGTNECGVTIGNEAVWTRLGYGKPALLGMDLLRLGLERGRTAVEALDWIIQLLETYGQGGNCGFDSELHYHNTFLITDATDGWVLETAGKFWAVEKLDDLRTISNVMSVHHPTRLHDGVVAYAAEQGWCSSEAEFDFADTLMDHFHPVNMGGTLRARCTERTLRAVPSVDLDTVKRALRSHNSNQPFVGSQYSSPCMHSAGSSQTTASLIAILDGPRTMYWATGMSTPCMAPFQPFWFDAYAKDLVFPYDQQQQAMDAWLHREQINRAALQGKIDLCAYQKELAELELAFTQQAAAAEQGTRAERQAVCDDIAAQTARFIDRWLEQASRHAAAPMGDKTFQETWDGFNQKLGQNRTIAY